MKNYLLSLLIIFSIATQAQTYQNPTFGKLTLKTNTLSTSTARINTQDTITGQINYINALSLPVPTSVINAIKQKADLSTGLIKNGLISENGDPTKFNITAGIGIISNFDDPENPISTIINFPAFNSITPTYLTTGNITYVAINSTPAVVMQATPFTPEQRRSLIVLGATIHSNLTTINVLNNISAPTNADTNQLHDFMEAVGALNITGNKYTANGANLQLNKSAGVLFKLGSNFAVDWKNPHEIAQAGGTAITFRYRTQNGTESADMTSISPGLYDLNNVLTTVPNNKFTIQTFNVFQTGLSRAQWDQTYYDDLQSAKNAILTREFAVENNIKENGVTRAYIIVRNSTTSLQNVSDAYITEAQKFGGVASGGVALTLANIVTALGYTPENEANKQNSLAVDGTGVKYATVDAINAGLATKQNTLTNPVTGTGTTNTISKWTGANTQGNSILSDSGTELTLNQTTNSTGLSIKGFTASTSFLKMYLNVVGDALINAPKTAIFSAGSTNAIYFRPGTGGLFFNDTNTSNLIFGSAGGNSLFNTTTNNGQGVAQFNGNITLSAGTLANHGVTFGQVFTSPTFTGVPSVPTATAGTNTTQAASTAFVINTTKWVQSVDDIYNVNTGNVGIGQTTGLTAKLNIKGSTTGDGTRGINLKDSSNTDVFYADNSGSVRAIGNITGQRVYSDFSFHASTESQGLIGNNSKSILNGGTKWLVFGEAIYGADYSSTYVDRSITDKGFVDKNRMKSYTVANLPASPTQGDSYAVTDALAPTYLSIVVGGGTVYAPVVWNGTNWVSH